MASAPRGRRRSPSATPSDASRTLSAPALEVERLAQNKWLAKYNPRLVARLSADKREPAEVEPNAVTDLIDRYCAVWNELDSARRSRLLAEIWADAATYTDPTIHARNGDELLAHIERVQARRPGSRVVRTTAVDVHHGVARFGWHVVQADGTSLPDGLDIAYLSSDGQRITRIVGFFGPLREARSR